MHEIGEHFIAQPIDSVDESDSTSGIELQPPIGDGQYWVLFRDLVGIPIPEGGEQFVVWSSNQKSVPRPTDDPNIPNVWWC